MGKRPTRYDVAQLAQVSVATVSYVVNNGPRSVSPETRKRVESAIQQLGYQPHAIARSLKTGSSQTVGLLVQSLLQSFTGSLVDAVEKSLASLDYGLILASSHENPERERKMLNVLGSQRIDGLLFVPASSHNREHAIAFIEAGIPLVFMDRYIPGVPADVVMTDNAAAARQLTTHLIDQGCRRLICLSFSRDASSAIDRVKGFWQALADRGLPTGNHQILIMEYASGVSSPDQPLLDYIREHGVPDGIICTTDDLIVRAIKTLRQLRIRVFDQVLVGGGFVNSPWAELFEGSIPIVHQDFQLMARKAVQFLLDRISGDDSPPRTELIEAHLLTGT